MIDLMGRMQLMEPLSRSLRGKLERAVKEAREIAEVAANASLVQLGVGDNSPPQFLTPEDRDLRKKLRIHGRQLGDHRDPKTDEQEIDLLTEEVAYQHWHRMLFARFLVENNLLMYPGTPPVAITLEECEELATEEGANNGWELASAFAARMLPQIFRPDSPVFKLRFPPEHEQNLEVLVTSLPHEVFIASDSIGWIYQYWQAKRKKDIDASGVKIGARELPAVTQLFTEPYMVSFLLDNSLGAWWAARRLCEVDWTNASSEEELRQRVSIQGLPINYLRFVRQEDGVWTPAAGRYDCWPGSLGKLKVIDPCCGSGHFLVGAFLMLVPMRMELESLSAREAVDRVLSENVHGLELDERCVELAAFALALAAWRYPDAGGYRTLPLLNVACSGLSVSVAKEEWKQLALDKHNLRIALDWIYEVFRDAPLLGSLLNPAKTDAAKLVNWDDLSQIIEQSHTKDSIDEQQEAAAVANGLAKASTLLSKQYDLVVTNVPYLSAGKQDASLREFCKRRYPLGKNDLATVFLERCHELCATGGVSGLVTPQNLLHQEGYEDLRRKILDSDKLLVVAKLGPAAFEEMNWWAANTMMLLIQNIKPSQNHSFTGIDASSTRVTAEKPSLLRCRNMSILGQCSQLQNPDARVVLFEAEDIPLLSNHASFHNGMQTGDYPRYGRAFWELTLPKHDWSYYQSTVTQTTTFGGRQRVLFWQDGRGSVSTSPAAVIRGTDAWKKNGVSISATGKLYATIYDGALYDENTVSLIPHLESELPAIWCFCSDETYNTKVRKINQTLKVRGDLVKVPFDLNHWSKVAEERFPDGLPQPYSNDPTQWIFHGHPAKAEHPLQVAVARLLGYRWPAEIDNEVRLSDKGHSLSLRCEELSGHADEDGIVCIMPARDEAAAADRLHNLLAAAYGADWSSDKLAELLKQTNYPGRSLDSWLREKFFTQHCQVFDHNPFIFNIWDGLRDGFAALVNYHKLDKKLLETLIYTYLGDWIIRQKQDISNGVDGAQEKLAAAEQLKKSLEMILEGETPYDIFVRWKPMEQQPIGWNPNLDDGVRINIRPFLTVPDVGKKGAGILRDKPNINWKKDRGKDIASAPWHHLFEGDRINDHHLTLAEKHRAQSKNNGEVVT